MSDDTKRYEELTRLANAGALTAFLEYARDLHASDLSDVLAGLDEDVRLRIVQSLPADVVSEAIAEMEDDEHPEELLEQLDLETAADIVEELEDDDAADLISDLPAEKAAQILSAVEVEDRQDIERLMKYDEESAGGLMTGAIVSLPDTLTAAQAIDEIRRQAQDVEEFYHVHCVDGERKLTGILPLQRLVVARPDALVKDLMEPSVAVATPEMDQEEVARLMARYNVPSIPVVDATGRLLGRVTFDDVIDVVEAEQTEDLLKFGGSGGDEQLGGKWHEAVRSRLPWLYLNLFTAFFAGAVVVYFETTITQIVLLAAIMPIVAGLGGNAGTQALAVTVRRTALGLLPPGAGLAMVWKEMLVGIINGLAVGLVVGLLTMLLGEGWAFGAVVTVAMWGSLIVAATVGASVPLLLLRLGFDPAVGSSVFITAITDIVGFFILLWLASAVLLPIG